MEDIINVQDQDTPLDVTDTPTKESGNNFWKNLLRTVLGITISIILTFGSNALIHWHRKAKDRKMTAMMVIGNIETFAENLEQSANRMRWNDTLATYLLVIPKDSLDLFDQDQLYSCINNVTAFYSLSHDNSAEHIFSNSIETWKNIGNFEFIENVGQCFADIQSIQSIYDEFFSTTDRIMNRMMQNPDAYQGNSIASKVLHDAEYRVHLMQIHSQRDYYLYLAAYLRWKNAKNMEMMDVTEEELKQFLEERNRKEASSQSAPDQNSFRTPGLNPNALPDFKDWINGQK